MKMSQLVILNEDLEKVSGFLAPFYNQTHFEKLCEMQSQIRSSWGDQTLETSGYIAFVAQYNNREVIRISIGNHFIESINKNLKKNIKR